MTSVLFWSLSPSQRTGQPAAALHLLPLSDFALRLQTKPLLSVSTPFFFFFLLSRQYTCRAFCSPGFTDLLIFWPSPSLSGPCSQSWGFSWSTLWWSPPARPSSGECASIASPSSAAWLLQESKYTVYQHILQHDTAPHTDKYTQLHF